MKLLIKNGRVIDPASRTDETLDILIDRGKITEVKDKIEDKDARVLEASRLVVAPGFIDMHTHLREPGQEYKETIKTGSRAAAKGGFTSIACMPNTQPVNDNRGTTEYILSQAKKSAVTNIFPIAAVSKEQKGKILTDMADIAEGGAVAFSDDGNPVANSQIMRRALEYSKIVDTPVIDHCEDKQLSEDGMMHEGYYSYLFGLKGIPSTSEEVMVSRNLSLARKAETPIHLAHISTKGSVEFIQQAKEKKIPVTAEVTPHHLFLTDASLKTYDPNLKVNPPLRSEEDVQSLMEGVKKGILDVFATDHAPHAFDEKDTEFDLAPFGINGLETAVSLILDRLVKKNLISISRFVQMISTTPASIFKLENKGNISPGADADLTILNLHKEITVDVNQFESKSRNSPFHGWKLRGAPVITIVGGKIVYSLQKH
ncbi:dihydroorotase [bacterium]|nr:dihydroorotase [bacterium]